MSASNKVHSSSSSSSSSKDSAAVGGREPHKQVLVNVQWTVCSLHNYCIHRIISNY